MEGGRAKEYQVQYVGFPEGKIPVSALLPGNCAQKATAACQRQIR
jgi:hypothetical protein